MRTERYCVQGIWVKQWVEMRSRPVPVSYAEIGRLYGVSASIVHRYTKNKVPRGRWGKYKNAFDHEEARRLEVEEKLPRAEIARRMGVSAARISQVLGPRRVAELWRAAA